MYRVVFEAEASEGEVRQVVSPPFPFPFPSPPPFHSPKFSDKPVEGRSDPVRGKFPGFPLQIPPCSQMVREFSFVQSTVVDHQALYRNRAKIWGSSLIFWLKFLEGVLHHCQKLSITASVFAETSTHTYRLSEEGFGYNYGQLKSLASHASRENTLLRCGKIRKRRVGLQRGWTDGRYQHCVQQHRVTQAACRRF